MPEIFIDTGAWLALADRRDNLHAIARTALAEVLQAGNQFVTTNLIVAETYTLIRRRVGHIAAIRFLKSTRSSPRVETIFSGLTLELEAMALLSQFADQDFSYVDAVSFAFMRELGIRQAFAFDRHFLTCGFVLLPSSSTA